MFKSKTEKKKIKIMIIWVGSLSRMMGVAMRYSCNRTLLRSAFLIRGWQLMNMIIPVMAMGMRDSGCSDMVVKGGEGNKEGGETE